MSVRFSFVRSVTKEILSIENELFIRVSSLLKFFVCDALCDLIY